MALRMKNPTHPGIVLHDLCIKPLNLTVTDAAQRLDVTRKTLSEVLNGRSGISPDMALRISEVFGGTAEIWVRMQASYELAQLRNNPKRPKLKQVYFPDVDQHAP